MSKKILIFGGTGAIGFSIAKKIIKEGYTPILISRNEEELVNKSKEINCEYEICDVLEQDQIDQISNKHADTINGLAYCVGSINLKPLKITKDTDFIESFKINTLGAINVIKSNTESLAKNNGSILLFSTIAVQQGFEFAPKIRVNCIAPSLTDSKMSQKMVSNENIRKAIENMHPIPKIGQGEDFGDLSSFLLSEKNSWITGQIFHIDGGRSTLRLKA